MHETQKMKRQRGRGSGVKEHFEGEILNLIFYFLLGCCKVKGPIGGYMSQSNGGM